MTAREFIDSIRNRRRVLIEAELEPVQGNRFQPTGFADIGAAEYELHDGTRMLLVESAQSIANRLEATIIGPNNEIKEEFEGLPYVRVDLTGDTRATTNSLIEAHRLNSPFIITAGDFEKRFIEKCQYKKGKPVNWHEVAKAVLHYDPNSLLHGLFLANAADGRIKLQRALSGFIEARNVKEAVSGGVKNNQLDPTGELRIDRQKKDVYSNVIYQRIEYTAEKITAYFNLDTGLLRSYRLGDDAFDLLAGLALYKVVHFLEGGLRLRTACDLKLAGGVNVTEPAGLSMPSADELSSFVQGCIPKVKQFFADPPVTQLTEKTTIVKAKGKSGAKSEE